MDDDLIHIQEHEAEMIERAEELQTNQFELEMRLLHIEHHRVALKQKKGELVAGSAAVFPQTYAQYTALGPANAAQVMQRQQQYDQAKMQQEAQPPAPQPPQGPRASKQAPGQPGPAPIAPGTPSANTPPAAQGGPG